MKRGARIAVALTILVLTVAADQLTKIWARAALAHATFRSDSLVLTLTENRGAFLSLGEQFPPALRFAVFTALVAIGLAAGTIWLFRAREASLYDVVCVSLLIGGGVGNLIDRATRDGAVTDFILLRAGFLHTGVFNVADVFVTTAAPLLLVRSIVTSRR
jgi:signal peptidase II